MIDSGVFLQTFLPVFVGVILSFLLWFGGQWFIGYWRNKKARAAMLQEIEEEIRKNVALLLHLVHGRAWHNCYHLHLYKKGGPF